MGRSTKGDFSCAPNTVYFTDDIKSTLISYLFLDTNTPTLGYEGTSRTSLVVLQRLHH